MLDATLVTGDWRLSELASANHLSTHGVLWLLDGMVHFKALGTKRAATALKCMLERGARLPAEECAKRVAQWSETKGEDLLP